MVGSGLILLPGNNECPYNYPVNTFPFPLDSTFLYFVGIAVPSIAPCQKPPKTLRAWCQDIRFPVSMAVGAII